MPRRATSLLGLCFCALAGCQESGNPSSASTGPGAASPCDANVGLNRDVMTFNGVTYTDGSSGRFITSAGGCTPIVRGFQNENATFVRLETYDTATGVKTFGVALSILATGSATGTYAYERGSSLTPLALSPTGDLSSPAQVCAMGPLTTGQITLTRNAAAPGQPIQGSYSFSNLQPSFGAICPATVTGTFDVTRE